MNMNLGILALISIIIVVIAGILVTSDLLPGISKEKQNKEPAELTSNDDGEGLTTEEPNDDSATNDENETEDIVIFAKSSGGGGGSYTSSSSSSTSPTPTPDMLTADAGGPYTGNIGELIVFNGSESFDPAKNITNYTWDFEGIFKYGVEVNYTYEGAGDYIVNLTITNATGVSANDSTSVTVIDPSNLPPVADAGPDQTVLVGETVTFDGSGSSDPDGTIFSYYWDFDDGTTSNVENPTNVYSAAGNYTVSLTVTNDDGATDTDSVTVIVMPIQDVLIWDVTLGQWEGEFVDGEADFNDIFGAETNVGGKIIYGTQWIPSSPGFYRVTFSLSDESNADFSGNTMIYNSLEENEIDTIISTADYGLLTDFIDILHEQTEPSDDGNCLSYPVIFSEDVRLQRGESGVDTFEGEWWWVWGYVIPDPTDDDASKFNEPLSCLPGDGNDPADPYSATCNSTLEESPNVEHENVTGVYSGDGNYFLTEVQAVFVQKDPLNVWQAQSEDNPHNDQILVTHVDFGDNLEAKQWPAGGKIRLEVALFQNRTENSMKGYNMVHTHSHGPDEVWGTTRNRYDNYMPIVYSSHAYLVIQKLVGDPETIGSAGILSDDGGSDDSPSTVVVHEHNLAYIDLEIVAKT